MGTGNDPRKTQEISDQEYLQNLREKANKGPKDARYELVQAQIFNLALANTEASKIMKLLILRISLLEKELNERFGIDIAEKALEYDLADPEQLKQILMDLNTYQKTKENEDVEPSVGEEEEAEEGEAEDNRDSANAADPAQSSDEPEESDTESDNPKWET